MKQKSELKKIQKTKKFVGLKKTNTQMSLSLCMYTQ